MEITEQLDELARKISANQHLTSRLWGGAGVVITNETQTPSGPGFYPDPDVVVTPYAPELSWLFEELRDVAIDMTDYAMWKPEYFGRLGVAASRVPASESVKMLLLATLREAYELLGRLEIGMDMTETAMGIEYPRSLGADIANFDAESIVEFYRLRGMTVL